jgi:hypothetical protein
MLLIPVYTYEHHMVQLIFPLVVVAGALARGRLSPRWGIVLAPSYLALAVWWSAMLSASKAAGGAAGWLLQEAKFFALVIVCLACAVAARRPAESAEAA